MRKTWNFQKTLALLLAAVLTLSCCPMQAQAAQEESWISQMPGDSAVGAKVSMPKLESGTSQQAAQTDAAFAGGSGTAASPYLIATKDQLSAIRNNLNAHYRLSQNITFTAADFAAGGAFYNNGQGWATIGQTTDAAFNGTLDGAGHSISGLQIKLDSAAEGPVAGLFGMIGPAGQVKNLTMSKLNIVGNMVSAGIACLNTGKITGCKVSGTVTAAATAYNASAIAGGVAALSSGTIENCSSSAKVTASAYRSAAALAGGVAGMTEGPTKSCTNYGAVSVTGPSMAAAGGVIGSACAEVTSCKNEKTGSVTALTDASSSKNANVGGICGEAYYSAAKKLPPFKVTGCQNKGSVTARNEHCMLGGVIGYASEKNSVSSCVNYGKVTSFNMWCKVGGVLGTSMSTVTSCRNEGTVTVNESKTLGGGIVGHNGFKVTSSHNNGTVTTTTGTSIAGVAGGNGTKDLPDATVSGCSNGTKGRVTANITKESQYAYISGVVGANLGKILSCYNAGTVTGNGGAKSTVYASGVVGESGEYGQPDPKLIVSGCYNKGTVSITGGQYCRVSGIASKSTGSLSKCYNLSDLSSTAKSCYVSGIAVENYGTASGCYNNGDLKTTGAQGEAVGIIFKNKGTISGCWNNGEIRTTGENAHVGGITCWNYGLVSACHNNGALRASGRYVYASGIAGNNDAGSTITRCYNTGAVSGFSASGICQDNRGILNQSYNVGSLWGNVDKYPRAGGIVDANHGTIADCFNAGTVSGHKAGGISTSNYKDGKIQSCYSTGILKTVGSYPEVGGVSTYNDGTIKTCVYRNNASKAVSFGDGATSAKRCTTTQMRTQSTFSGFNFSSVWTMAGNSDYRYPELKNTTMKYSTVKITAQPVSVRVANGQTASVTVKATGNGLTYQWYTKAPGAKEYVRSSVTGPTYAVEMNASRNGRWVNCLITDSYGNQVRSKTVALSMGTVSGPKIVTEPHNVSVPEGKTATVTVKATGTGLKYEWYLKNKTTGAYVKSSVTGPSYSVPMTASRNGRWVKCKVTDSRGVSVWSKTVSLTIQKSVPLKIITQPHNVTVANGQKAMVFVEAQGEGLQYAWYVKNPGSDKYLRSSVSSRIYAVPMSPSRNGRLLKCKITDKYGKTVWANTVRISMK